MDPKFGLGTTVLAADGTRLLLPNSNSGVKDSNGNLYALNGSNVVSPEGFVTVIVWIWETTGLQRHSL